MTVIPSPRGPVEVTGVRSAAQLDFTTTPKVWTPSGTAGEVIPARNLKSGDQVLVHRSFGCWAFSNADPEATPRFSVWATVTERVRRCFALSADGLAAGISRGNLATNVAVRKLDHPVIRRTMPVSVPDFQPGHSGMSCVRMVERPDGTGDACGEPVKSAIHDPAGYSSYYTELKTELGKYERREPPYDGSDALDLALETAFPSAPPELETMRDKVRGHLEAARARVTAAETGCSHREVHRATAVVEALEALARDLEI
jgi:hypothetical protein